MAVHEPPLGLPFVDEKFYVARPWVEWLILAQSNFVDLEASILPDDELIAENAANIVINADAIAANTVNITTNAENITTLQASILSNEALSYYFASL